MEFVTLKYNGTKDYRDRTVMRNHWKPGDVKPVPAREAKKLLQFVEFARHEGDVPQELQAYAQAVQATVQELDERKKRELANVQISIDQMDKGALEVYAKQYGVNLDKRRSVETLRQEVNNLIELHGAM